MAHRSNVHRERRLITANFENFAVPIVPTREAPCRWGSDSKR
jgi:hypothetical protein